MRNVSTLLSQCLQPCRSCAAAFQSRLFSAGSGSGSTDDPFVTHESDLTPSLPGQFGGVPDVAATGANGRPESGRWFAKRHTAPQRKDMYHRRHREQKKLEKQQDRLNHLQEIHQEAYSKGATRIAEAAGGEAERLQRPWLQRNIPVKPPTYASVSGGRPKQVKAVTYTGNELPRDNSLGLPTETRSMDVLNFKVGYAVDAQYALPAEVQAFVLDQTTFCLYGVDKNQVTQIASNIRRIRPPEPYKGAGIRIVGESVKIKDRRVK